MKILVFGSEGQIGKPFCELALKEGHQLICVDKKLGPSDDLSDKNCHKLNTLQSSDFDVIVFLAFEVGGSKYLLQKDKSFDYISENVKLMANTFDFLKRVNKPFLFASSQMANMHHTNYGFLKDLGERYTRSLGGHICRFWNVYGHEDPNDPKSHVITDFISMARKGRIVMKTTGKEERQFLHADDCSMALLQWCLNHENISKDEYLDITSFEWNTILDIANIISDKFHCEIVEGSTDDKIQAGIKNDPSPYFKKFWSPTITLKEGIGRLML